MKMDEYPCEIQVANQLSYSTGLASSEPVAPEQLPSAAPLTGGGGAVVVMLSSLGNVTIELRSFDRDGDDLLTQVVSLPTFGSLTLVGSGDGVIDSGGIVVDTARTSSKRVVYSAGIGGLAEAGDNFTFSVFDGGDYANGS